MSDSFEQRASLSFDQYEHMGAGGSSLLSEESFDKFLEILDAPVPREAVELLERKPIWKQRTES